MVKLQPGMLTQLAPYRNRGFRFGMVKLQRGMLGAATLLGDLFPLWHGKVATVLRIMPLQHLRNGFRFGMVKLQLPNVGFPLGTRRFKFPLWHGKVATRTHTHPNAAARVSALAW